MPKTKRTLVSKAALALGAWAAYVLAFIPLYHLAGRVTPALAILPVVAAGWLLGTRAGLLAGLLAFPLNVLLTTLTGEAGWDMMTPGGVFGSVIILLTGVAVGRLRDLGERAKQELARREQAEEELGKHRHHLEELVQQRTPKVATTNEQLEREIAGRERAEETLRKSEERYRTILENIEDGYYEVDIAGNLTFFNDALCRLYGYPADELMGMNYRQYMDDQDARSVYKAYNAVYRTGKSARAFDWQVIRKDGTRRIVEVSVSLISGSSGGPIGFRGIVRDITERKAVEEALRVSEERFALAMRGSNDGVWDWDIQNNSLYWSPRAKELLGYADDELDVDFDVLESHLHPDDEEDMKAALEAHLKNRVPYDIEQRLRTKSGEYRWFRERGQAVWDENGQPTRMAGSTTDITERKQVEEALKRRAAQLALINDIGGKIAAVLELDSVLERAARLVQESFGYHHVALFTVEREQDALVMKTRAGDFAHLFPLDHQLKLGQGMVGWVGLHGERLLVNDVDAEPRYVNLYPDLVPTRSELSVPIRVGEEIVGVLDAQSPRLDAFDENDVMLMETLADQVAVAIENAQLYEAVERELTERKRTEEQLQRYATELEQTNEEVKQFAYIVSHDLRAPLVNLKGFSAELRAALAVIGSATITALPHLDEKQQQTVTTALEEDVPEALGFIDSSVARMDRFINAVLKLSRLGRRELKLEPIDMGALVQATLQTLAHQIEGRQTEVTVERLPKVVADRTSMEQIMGNILINAVEYLAPGRPGEIEVTAEHDHDVTAFHIRDNGRGIAEEDMGKVH